LSGIVALIGGNILGAFLDNNKLSKRLRSRWAFIVILTLQGAWWLWGTVLVTQYRKTRPTYDWSDAGFGSGFAWFLLQVIGFQLNYMYLYFVVASLAKNEAEIIRYSGLLRGTESAVQAVSYGLGSVAIMGEAGCTYINFGLWAISLYPAWLVIRKIGEKTEREWTKA
jgi:hypothetical protein